MRKMLMSLGLGAGLLAGGVACSGGAQAAVVNTIALARPVATEAAIAIPARWVCGPRRCWWRPGPRWRGPRWHVRRCWVRRTPWGWRRVCRFR